MELTSKQTYQAPPRRLHRVLTDFDAFEALITGTGAKITARQAGAADGTGRGWTVQGAFKGLERIVEARITRVTRDQGFQLEAKTDGAAMSLNVEIAPGAETGSEVVAIAKIEGRGITGRMMMATLSMARTTLEPKFDARFVNFTRARLKAARAANRKDKLAKTGAQRQGRANGA